MNDAEKQQYDALRSSCWKKAIQAHATGYIFAERHQLLRRRLTLLNFTGIVVPAAVGIVVINYGSADGSAGSFITVASVFASVQLVGSVWSLAANWNEAHAYAKESSSANHLLSSRFKTLAENPPASVQDFRQEFRVLAAQNEAREQTDHQQAITDNEMRLGHRAGLRQFERKCADCQVVPTSMNPTNCPVCGAFKVRRF